VGGYGNSDNNEVKNLDEEEKDKDTDKDDEGFDNKEKD
jgi:hypothetical protein